MATSLAAVLGRIRDSVARCVNPPVLLYFTDHSIYHCDRVARYALAISSRCTVTEKRLSPDELYVLLAACYLHDVALQATRVEGVSNRVEDLNKKDYENIRRRHPTAAANWIKQNLRGEHGHVPRLDVDATPEAKRLGTFVARLVEHHSGPIPQLPTEDHHGGQLRLQLLLAILRLADGLDLDETRVDLDQLLRWDISPQTKVHWWRHHYVSSVAIRDGRIQVTMRFPPEMAAPYISYFKDQVEHEVRRELDPAEEILFDNDFHLRFSGVTVSSEYTDAKRAVPEDLRSYIDSKITAPPEVYGQAEPRSQKDLTKSHWIAYWGFQGNPWTDLPRSYDDKRFVQTASFRAFYDELDQLLKGSDGEIKLVFGPPGAGKTTLMESIGGRLGEKAFVARCDLARVFSGSPTANEVMFHVFPTLVEQLSSQSPPKGRVGPETIAAVMNEFHRKRPVVLIDNLDRYSEQANLEVVRRFFELAQGNLQAMKRKAIVIISATDAWKPEFDRHNVKYLGKNSGIALKKFTPAETRELIERRLNVAGTTVSQVFDEDAIKIVCALSDGNPRSILETCETLCRGAAEEKVELISKVYVEKRFKGRIKTDTAKAIWQVAKDSPRYNDALSAVYTFNLMVEREAGSRQLAWTLFRRLASGDRVAQSEVPRWLIPAVAKVARLTVDETSQPRTAQYVAQESILEYLKETAQHGVDVAGFVSCYLLKPIRPPSLDESALARDLELLGLDEPVVRLLQRGQRLLQDALDQRQPPALVLLRCRYTIEAYLGAYALSKGLELPPGFRSDHENGMYYDDRGQQHFIRIDDQVEILDVLLENLVKTRTRWLAALPEARYIRARSSALLRDHRIEGQLGPRDAEIFRNAASKVADELTGRVIERN